MKKIVILAIIATAAVSASAQSPKESNSRIGIKAGYNFSNVVGSGSSFDPQHTNGYMVSAFFSPSNKNGLGYRSELVYSKQGYSFDDGGKNTDVMNDYLYMPHLMT